MISYELTKELKDAGFRQRFKRGAYYAEKNLTYPEGQRAHFFLDERTRGTPETELAVSKLISIPTLSELIEACGERFAALRKIDPPAPDKWIANADFNRERQFWNVGAEGSTPEEAVARLWLALSKTV